MISCSDPTHSHETLATCDAWLCECGNTDGSPRHAGFLVRDLDEPEMGEGIIAFDERLCGECGRVYDADGRERRQEAL
jgi:hypothetical protein